MHGNKNARPRKAICAAKISTKTLLCRVRNRAYYRRLHGVARTLATCRGISPLYVAVSRQPVRRLGLLVGKLPVPLLARVGCQQYKRNSSLIPRSYTVVGYPKTDGVPDHSSRGEQEEQAKCNTGPARPKLGCLYHVTGLGNPTHWHPREGPGPCMQIWAGLCHEPRTVGPDPDPAEKAICAFLGLVVLLHSTST